MAEKTMQDYTNKKFGKLLIVKGVEGNTSKNKPNKYKKYECLCDCGKTINIKTSQLVRGTKSCGCLRIYNNLTTELYTGLKINRLTVIGFCDENKKWKFSCSCGTIYFSDAKRVLNGNTKSCGCLNSEVSKDKAIVFINNNTNSNPIEVLALKIYRDRYSDGNLNFNNFYTLSQQNCFYCGVNRSNKLIKKPSKYSYLYSLPEEQLTFRYNGLDRIDSSLPHNLENCVSSCYFCNHAKSDMNQEMFISYLKRLITNKVSLSFDEYRKLSKLVDMSFFNDKTKYSLIKSIKHIHKQRYRDGNLSLIDLYQLSQLDCFYCGAEPNNLMNRAKTLNKSQFARDTGDFIYNGLDRIDPTKPH